MFKKLLVAAILTANYSIAFADAPYISGNLSIINNASNGGRSDYRGFSGNFALGYSGIVGSRIYLGGEAFAIPGSATITGNDLSKNHMGCRRKLYTWHNVKRKSCNLYAPRYY